MEVEERLQQLEGQMQDLDKRVQRLYGPHVEIIQSEINPQGEVMEGPHAEVVAGEGPPPGMSLEEWISGVAGSPGFVVDAGIARSTPCIQIELGEGYTPLVYSKGIVGALDDEQKELYCQEGYITRQASPQQRERIEALRSASKLCSQESEPIPETSQRLSTYFSCLGRHLRERGMEP